MRVRKVATPSKSRSPGSGARQRGRLDGYLQRSAGAGRPLAAPVRRDFESSFGHSLSQVRVVDDDGAARAADALDARAFSVGSTIWMGRGEHQPDTSGGRRLLAHEVAHTLQAPAGVRAADKITTGSGNDPAEADAERAADAVMRGAPARVNPAPGGIVRMQKKRVCTTQKTGKDDQRLIKCGNDTYRVTLSWTPYKVPKLLAGITRLGFNNTDVFADILICKGGTHVVITPNVNLPQAVVQALGNMLSGQNALAGVQLKPGLQITIVQSQRYAITLKAGVVVSFQQPTAKVIGGSGQICYKWQGGEICCGGQGTSSGGTVNCTFRPGGGGAPTKAPCVGTARHYYLACEKVGKTKGSPAVTKLTKTLPKQVYVLFHYAKPKMTNKFKMGVGKQVADVPASKIEEELVDLAAKGYRAKRIEGRASPEGPRKPVKGFMGNDELSKRRAAKAEEWLRKICPACPDASMTREGLSELYSNEKKGRAQSRYAIKHYLDEDPLAPQDPAARRRFERQSHAYQRKHAYMDMRRAVIYFSKSEVIREARPAVLPKTTYTATTCPADVVSEAQKAFGVTIMTIGNP